MGEARQLKRWIFTHHKCASAWSRELFRRIAEHESLSMSVHDSYPHMRPETAASRTEVERELGAACASDFVYDANARPHCLEALQNAAHGADYRAIHIVRDPRDVLVSAYYSHRNVHPTDVWPALATQRDRLRSLSLEAGLVDEIEFAAFCLDGIATWDYRHPRVLTVRYEDLFGHRDPRPMVELMLGWLDLELPTDLLADLLSDLSFEKLAEGRSHGEESRFHHYRKGTPGDWQNHFTPDLERAFKHRYGEALVAAGYEADLAW